MVRVWGRKERRRDGRRHRDGVRNEREKEKVRGFPSVLSNFSSTSSTISSFSSVAPAPLLHPYPSLASLSSHRRKVINTSGRCAGEAHTAVGRGVAGTLCEFNCASRPFSSRELLYVKEKRSSVALPKGERKEKEKDSRDSSFSLVLSARRHVAVDQLGEDPELKFANMKEDRTRESLKAPLIKDTTNGVLI